MYIWFVMVTEPGEVTVGHGEDFHMPPWDMVNIWWYETYEDAMEKARYLASSHHSD